MKHALKLSLLAAALFGTTMVASSVASACPGGKHGDKTKRAEMIKKYDANKNGVLDDAERMAVKKARHAERLAKYDANKDGTLDDGERQRMRAERGKLRFAKLDSNKDGVIRRAEVQDKGRFASRFDQIDKDKSGTITLAELQAAKGKYRGKHGGKHHRGGPIAQ